MATLAAEDGNDEQWEDELESVVAEVAAEPQTEESEDEEEYEYEEDEYEEEVEDEPKACFAKHPRQHIQNSHPRSPTGRRRHRVTSRPTGSDCFKAAFQNAGQEERSSV